MVIQPTLCKCGHEQATHFRGSTGIWFCRLCPMKAGQNKHEYEPARFNGDDYQPPRDNPRLSAQFTQIFRVMRDAEWRTLRQIANITDYPEASISAQLRHMRKERFGGHSVDKEHLSGGLYHYRLRIRQPLQPRLI